MRSARLRVVQSADGSSRVRSRNGAAAVAYVNGPAGGGSGGGRLRFVGEAELHLTLLTAAGAGAGARCLKAAEAMLADCLRQCLLLADYPNAHIYITATLVESPASAAAASADVSATLMMACVLALIDAGLSMARVPLACAHEGSLFVCDNGSSERGFLACWGQPPAPELLAPEGALSLELQRLEEFVRRVCKRRIAPA